MTLGGRVGERGRRHTRGRSENVSNRALETRWIIRVSFVDLPPAGAGAVAPRDPCECKRTNINSLNCFRAAVIRLNVVVSLPAPPLAVYFTHFFAMRFSLLSSVPGHHETLRGSSPSAGWRHGCSASAVGRTRWRGRAWGPLVALVVAFAWLVGAAAAAAPTPRPMIWVRPADRAEILRKIETQPWAAKALAASQERTASWVSRHQSDRAAFLRGLPLVFDPQKPGSHPTLRHIGGNMAALPEADRHNSLQSYIVAAVDCGVLYYLTGKEEYAACAADVLHTVVEALVLMPTSDSASNGGWIYPTDHLYEARALGAQIPIIYDFIAEYLRGGATVLNIGNGRLQPFPLAKAQQVFRTYATLALEHGIIDCNWPVLEMPSLTHNVLALDDPAERTRLLAYVTERDTPHQDSLRKVLGEFSASGGIWPESFQYSSGVSHNCTYIVALLRRQQPALLLPSGYSQLPRSIARLRDFRFPNGEFVHLGDGPREANGGMAAFEIAYALGRREGDAELCRAVGGEISRAIESGSYDRAQPEGPARGAQVYLGPLQLLWYADQVTVAAAKRQVVVTDALPFAGLVLQRNLSPDSIPAHGLMAAVAGAPHVHSHASGMALELYGVGQVLGAASGKGTYSTDEHENYRRIFAGYNTVIVNGASTSSGGWANLGTDTVRPLALEPAIGAEPVSSRHSFTVTEFTDREVGGGTARQQRLVGIVRTSNTTGFYVDVFRSKAAGPGSDQFHDYLYHNLGDTVELTAAAAPLAQTPAPKRFQLVPGSKWERNRSYLVPGWHVFKDVKVSAPTAAEVLVRFPAAAMAPRGAEMRAYFAGMPDREFASAFSLPTKSAPAPYDKKRTPVLAVRQKGEAWTRPFAVVFEPREAAASDGVVSVAPLRGARGFSGFVVESRIGGRVVRSYVLTSDDALGEFRDEALGLEFSGRYAVVTTDAAGRAEELYLGSGRRLEYRGAVLRATGAEPVAGCVNLSTGQVRWAKPDGGEYRAAH